MYTEQDRQRKQNWLKVFDALTEVLHLYQATLAADNQANKPMFESNLMWIRETALAQSELWSNPDKAEQTKIERDNNIYSL